MRRLRAAPKTPLAVAGILATPLFFVALMAFSLLLEEPSVQQTRRGAEALGDPTTANEVAIYASSFLVSALVVGLGVAALLLARSVALFLPAGGAILATLLLLIPLDTWQKEHAARYPDGIDLIPRRDPSDLILRGEWEESAKQTADQIGLWTIAIALAAMAIHIAFEVRRRRGAVSPPAPPPPPKTVGPA